MFQRLPVIRCETITPGLPESNFGQFSLQLWLIPSLIQRFLFGFASGDDKELKNNPSRFPNGRIIEN
jgi:hypothetical protein